MSMDRAMIEEAARRGARGTVAEHDYTLEQVDDDGVVVSWSENSRGGYTTLRRRVLFKQDRQGSWTAYGRVQFDNGDWLTYRTTTCEISESTLLKDARTIFNVIGDWEVDDLYQLEQL